MQKTSQKLVVLKQEQSKRSKGTRYLVKVTDSLFKNFLISVNAVISFYIMPNYNHSIFNHSLLFTSFAVWAG